MDFSIQPDITLLLRTPRNAKKMTVKTENLKLEGESVTSFDILLYQKDSLLEIRKNKQHHGCWCFQKVQWIILKPWVLALSTSSKS